MGLMLSIIVSCVGVLELFAFYTNVRRAVTAGEAHPTNASDLSCITGSYIRDLNRERNKLLEEIRRLENSKEIAVGSSDRHEERVSINTNSDLAPIKEKHVSRIFPTYTESHPIVVTDASEVSIISEPSTFHRESSPFPSYDRIAPRHSICSELVENPVVSVYEIDEENYRSPISSEAPSPEDYLKSNFDSPQYWRRRSHSRSHSRSRSRTPEISNKDLENKEYSNSNDLLLNVPNIKSCKRTEETRKSSSSEYVSVSTEFVEQTQLRRPESPFQKIVELQPSAEPEVTVVEPEEDNKDEFDKNVLNSVDGLKSKQVEEHRRQFKNKKKGKKNEVVERTTQEVAGPSSSGSNPEPFWLIFSGEYTKAMNKDWHGQHFCCWQCDESLTGQRYVLRDEHPYCVSCYESVFANGCEKCNKIIGIDSKDLSYKDKHWHEACFLCTACGESLVDKQFGSRSDRIYCGKCYDEKFASRCDGCSEIFRAGTKKMEYKTRQWHEKCFCCVMCKTPIGTQSFIPREQEIYCAKCYEEKYATRCIKCNKVITSGGVTYKNEPWHRECFTCTNCQTSLAGARFTSRDDKPYCADCFGELFAKRCYACSKPITGIGGTKFISFEDRHWHNDCFYCASCRTSLVGKGFITDNTDIICPECAKQKLN